MDSSKNGRLIIPFMKFGSLWGNIANLFSRQFPALCLIPDIKYGEVLHNTAGSVVPRGYIARVECFPAHIVTGSAAITCLGGVWSDIPTCNLGNVHEYFFSCLSWGLGFLPFSPVLENLILCKMTLVL